MESIEHDFRTEFYKTRNATSSYCHVPILYPLNLFWDTDVGYYILMKGQFTRFLSRTHFEVIKRAHIATGHGGLDRMIISASS